MANKNILYLVTLEAGIYIGWLAGLLYNFKKMHRKPWTLTEESILTDIYPDGDLSEISELLGRTIPSIKSRAKRLSLKRTPLISNTNKDLIKKEANSLSFQELAEATGLSVRTVMNYIYRHKLKANIKTFRNYIPSEDEYLRNNYRDTSSGDMAKSLGRTKESVRKRLASLGLERTKMEIHTIIASYASNGRFRKYHLPKNTLYDGAITIRKDTSGNKYKYIRLSKGVWVLYHKYLWEQEYGTVPEGKCLRCKDRDATNCDLDNWELIDKKENLVRNSGRDELTDSYLASILSIRQKSLRQELLKYPELLEIKRLELTIKREINEHTY